jgi:hypothetical protein
MECEMNFASNLFLLFFFSMTVLGVSDEPKPPKTHITIPGQLVTAEAFDRAESLAPKGTAGWRGGIGDWRVEGGSAHAKDEKPSAARPNGHEAVCEYVTELHDLVMTAEFKLGTSPQVGFVCRDTNNPNHHLGRIMVTPTAVWLQKMSGIAKQTSKEILQKIDAQFDPEQWYQVTIEISGDTWRATVGDHELTAKHDRFKDPKGRVGMVAKGEGAQFRNVALWKAHPK